MLSASVLRPKGVSRHEYGGHEMKTGISMITIILTLSLYATTAMSEAQNALPEFDKYQVKSMYSGKVAVIDPAGESMFHTRLIEAARQDVNFAGEYVLTTWGCGSGCFDGAAVNIRTGKVAYFPGAMHRKMFSDDEVLQYRRNSRLFIMTGYLDEKDDYATYYYELTGNSFKLIKIVKQ